MGLFQRRPSKHKFAKMLMDDIRQAGETEAIQYDPDEFCLSKENRGTLNLGNAYKDYCGVGRKDRHRISTDRDTAKEDEGLSLLGLEHPLIHRFMARHRNLEAAERGLVGSLSEDREIRGAISVWHVEAHGGKGQVHQQIVTTGVNQEGERSCSLEHLQDYVRDLQPTDQSLFNESRRAQFVRSAVPQMVRRELEYAGMLDEETSFSARLLAWIAIG